MYHFVTGYTSRVEVNEEGLAEPQAAFCPCFGVGFIVWHPVKYTVMLADKLSKHGSTVWLVNTGWTGGRYGVGKRISIRYTRAILNAIHSGELAAAEYTATEVFQLQVPTSCSGLPREMLRPETSWPSQGEFDNTVLNLATKFIRNFRLYSDGGGHASPEFMAKMEAAGPVLPQGKPWAQKVDDSGSFVWRRTRRGCTT